MRFDRVNERKTKVEQKVSTFHENNEQGTHHTKQPSVVTDKDRNFSVLTTFACAHELNEVTKYQEEKEKKNDGKSTTYMRIKRKIE